MWMTLNHLKTNSTKLANYRFKTQKVIEFFEFQSLTQHPLCQQTVHRITKFHSYFQLKSKWDGKLVVFSKKLIKKSQNNYQRTKMYQ